MAARSPSLCFAGPMSAGKGGHSTTQAEILAELFAAEGYEVRAGSRVSNRFLRPLDLAGLLLRGARRVDALVVQTYSGPAFVLADMATAVGAWLGQKIVIHLHGGGLPGFFEAHPSWTRRVVRRADAVVAPSSYLAAAVAPLGVRARVIPNVLDLSLYPYRERERLRPRLFWMRSFHDVYNPSMALRTVALVRERIPDATLVMAGANKGLLEAVREEAGTLGLDHAVRFPGFLDPSAKAREGSAADIFLSTSRVDNAPVTVLEACAMGLPVVATDVGGVRDLLNHERTGLLVPSDDPEAMAAGILRLLERPTLARRLSSEGRSLAEESAWPRVRRRWDALFRSLGAPGNGKVPARGTSPSTSTPDLRHGRDREGMGHRTRVETATVARDG